MKKHTAFKTVLCGMALCTALCSSFPGTQAMAADKVVVIPLGSAKQIAAKELSNVVTVSATGGDFTSPSAAVASITTASASNPYLVLIGPGVYTLTSALVMKPYVTIAGSGEEATTLTGAISSSGTADPSSAIISGADHATLRDLRVANTGGSEYSIALANMSCSPVIENITAAASGDNNNYGIYNNASSPAMTNVTATTTGGVYNVSVYNYNNSAPSMTNVIAIATGGADQNGVYNHNSSPTMTNVTATASGGTASNNGVFNNNSSPAMTGVSATASGGASDYGVRNFYASPMIRHCTLNGTTKGLSVTVGTTRVMQSSIIGGVTNNAGTLSCINSDNGVSAALHENCL